MLTVGDKAPYFEGYDQNNKRICLHDFKGKKLVLYFYPKDNTPGCTAEACSIRDNIQDFLKNNYIVVGVSSDSIESHKKFAEKYQLPFSLIADADKTIQQSYEAYGEKKMYGKVVKGTIRKTFIIDENGIIERIIEKVDTKNHAIQILKNI
ncbi:MAG: thioredoxin-dependent thiol peroxidase [Bacteroidales bacterium]|nr:thioredoxin-dependent thiol peroxidase [Bacteroidales bacterium]